MSDQDIMSAFDEVVEGDTEENVNDAKGLMDHVDEILRKKDDDLTLLEEKKLSPGDLKKFIAEWQKVDDLLNKVYNELWKFTARWANFHTKVSKKHETKCDEYLGFALDSLREMMKEMKAKATSK